MKSVIERKLVLASTSPRRKELMRDAGLELEIIAPNTEEQVLPGEKACDFVRRAATEKAVAAELKRSDANGGAIIIAADTVIEFGGEILGKPRDCEEARSMLNSLSDNTHTVLTGICLLDSSDGSKSTKVVETRVTFKQLAPSEIDDYVSTGDPLDKAGAYAIQGQATHMIKSIEGSYTNVVGLPMGVLLEMLHIFAPQCHCHPRSQQ